MTLESFSTDIINRRRLFRAHRIKSARILEIGVWHLNPEIEPDEGNFRSEIKAAYEQIYGLDPLTLLLLGVLLNALVKILIDWWQRKHAKDELLEMKAGCTNIQNLINTGYRGDGHDPDDCSISLEELQND